MYVTRRARRMAPPEIKALFAVATLIGGGAFCLAIVVAYGWGASAATDAHVGRNAVFTGLVALLVGFVMWLWRQLAMAREEMRHGGGFR
jgi:hypothetical protein